QTVFVSVSRELLDACCQSLELAADKIRQLPIDPAKATVKNLGRALDAELFLVKHLLIIREQTSPYRVTSKNRTFSREEVDSTATRFDYAIDLSKYKNSMYELLNPENRSRWFELSSNNAIISFLLSAPVQVSELQTDSRRIIENQLKKHCQRLIRFVTDLVIGGLLNLSQAIAAVESVEGPAQAEAMKDETLKPKAINDAVSVAFKNLKQNWAQIRNGFSLYIGSRETEEILLQPIRKAIVDAFTNVNLFTQKNFTEEQRQVASVPNQEQIWLLLNSS
ncbi:CRE-COGC-3 protein, partial [Aphelenchoides avenae]